jgi:hypothetical protein
MKRRAAINSIGAPAGARRSSGICGVSFAAELIQFQ